VWKQYWANIYVARNVEVLVGNAGRSTNVALTVVIAVRQGQGMSERFTAPIFANSGDVVGK
jgi:hypothetical protein